MDTLLAGVEGESSLTRERMRRALDVVESHELTWVGFVWMCMLPVMYGKRRRDSFTIMISTISSAAETSLNFSLVVSDEARVVHSTIRSLFSGFWISKKAIAYGFFQSPAKCNFLQLL